jgi:hypothetical protein
MLAEWLYAVPGGLSVNCRTAAHAALSCSSLCFPDKVVRGSDMPELTVEELYDEIFSSDPFLVQGHSQERYAKAFLKHLIIYRTLRATLPTKLDLNADADRRRFQRRTRTPPAMSDEALSELRDRYEAARRARETVSDDDREPLRAMTMVSDGRFTRRRREQPPRGYARHLQAEQELERARMVSTMSKRLRIATIGYRVRISKFEAARLGEELRMLAQADKGVLLGLEERANLVQLGRTALANEDSTDWADAVVRHIEIALERGSHIIVLPEFALPPNGNAAAPIDVRIKSLSEGAGHDHFLFAGTRHEGGVNRGLVFVRENERVSSKWWHYKLASARGLGENILGPFGKRFPIYRTVIDIEGRGAVPLAVMVAICYDSFDPSMFLNLMFQGVAAMFEADDVLHKVILVPSFNNSPDFVALLRDLSFVARCTVVYVDGLHGNARMFVCGIAISDLNNDLDRVEGRVAEAIRLLDAELQKNTRLRRQHERRKQTKAYRDHIAHIRHTRDLTIELRAHLAKLRDKGILRHLVTVEGPVDPRTRPTLNGCYHEDDVLYYNLDLNLIGLLASFRDDLFENDAFMPEPFHLNELREAYRLQQSTP